VLLTKQAWAKTESRIKQINEEKYGHGEYTLEKKGNDERKMKDNKKKTKRRKKSEQKDARKRKAQ
jgi:hypothetical protein